jgi:hypothetical protein
MATNQQATTEELLEAVFSVVRATAIATQRSGKLVSVATNPDATLEELLKSVFSARYGPRYYNWDGLEQRSQL